VLFAAVQGEQQREDRRGQLGHSPPILYPQRIVSEVDNTCNPPRYQRNTRLD